MAVHSKLVLPVKRARLQIYLGISLGSVLFAARIGNLGTTTLLGVVALFGAGTIVLGATRSFTVGLRRRWPSSSGRGRGERVHPGHARPLLTPADKRGGCLPSRTSSSAARTNWARRVRRRRPAYARRRRRGSIGGAIALVVSGDVVEAVPLVRGVDRFQTAQEASSARGASPRGISASSGGRRLTACGHRPSAIRGRSNAPARGGGTRRADASGWGDPRRRERVRRLPDGSPPRRGRLWCRGSSGSCRATRSSRSSRCHNGTGRVPGSRSATGSGSPGCATPAVVCRFCVRATRTSAWHHDLAGWDDDGGLRRVGCRRRAGQGLPCRASSTTGALRRCSVPGSSGAPSSERHGLSHPAGTSGVYGFGASAHIAAQVALFEGGER